MIIDVAERLIVFGFVNGVDFRCRGNGPTDVIVEWLSVQPMPSEAAILAVDLSPAATATRSAQKAKAIAAASIDNGATINADQRERIERCIVDIIRLEFNRHTDVEAAMFDAVAAATSLADLKTRYAAITQVPQRSLADLVAAIKTALAATPE